MVTDTEEPQIELPEDKKAKNVVEGRASSDVDIAEGDMQSLEAGRMLVGDGIEIFPNKPLPELSTSYAQAFEARDNNASIEMYALLCGRENIPRITAIASYQNLRSPNILALNDAGLVYYPLDRKQYLALVYERPAGEKLLNNIEDDFVALSEDVLVNSMIKPVLWVLNDLKNADLVHGNINLSNMFMVGADGSKHVVLGECLSTSCSMGQPVIFETIERSMADSEGRGVAKANDDLYAFGVCVAFMARGENFLKGKTDQEVIYGKIEQGSYGALLGRDRLPGGLTEFLRAVLNDDPKQRWDIGEALKWLEGRRLSPKQSRTHIKSSRPYIFNEQKHWYLKSLAYAFSDDPYAASKTIMDEEFMKWLRRNFDQKLFLANIDMAFELGGSSEGGALVTRVCMALDSSAPIHYMGHSFMPDGFGNSLAHAIAEGKDTQPYVETLKKQFFHFLFNMHGDEASDLELLLANFESCRGVLSQKMAGYGLERVLYVLCAEAPCLSPVFKNFFIMNPGGVLKALEVVAASENKPETLLDRHAIAFIFAREPRLIDKNLGLLISPDKGSQVLGILRTLAAIQKRFKIPSVPNTVNWMIGMMDEVIDKYYDIDLRNKMKGQVRSLTNTGSLLDLLYFVDDPLLKNDDSMNFAKAKREFLLLSHEKQQYLQRLQNKKMMGVATGRQFAMVTSAILSMLCIIGFIVLHFMGGGI